MAIVGTVTSQITKQFDAISLDTGPTDYFGWDWAGLGCFLY